MNLSEFSKDFLARIAVSKLNWQVLESALTEAKSNDGSSEWEEAVLKVQEDVLGATILHPLCVKYPPPSSYIQSFLKTFISKVERHNVEVHTTALETFTDLLSSNNQTEEAGHRTFLLDELESISLKENISIISDGTTGLCTWQAAFYLAEWCIHNVDKIRKRRVVELGSGSGLVGLTCLKKCSPSSVILTDYHPKVLETLLYNVNLNKTSGVCDITVESLDWREFSENPEQNPLFADVILASDVVYDIDLIPALVGSLHQLLQRSHLPSQEEPFAVMACTVRNEDTLKSFLTEIGICGLSYVTLDHAPPIFSCDRSFPVRLFFITLK